MGEGHPFKNQDLQIEIGDYALDNFPENGRYQLYSIVANDKQIRGFSQSSQALSNLGLVNGRDVERLSNARQLSPNEYTFNQRLGFISLNQALNNAEVLAVGYQYTLNGRTYQVGDL